MGNLKDQNVFMEKILQKRLRFVLGRKNSEKSNERRNILINFLKNPGASTNPYPGDRKDQAFYTNTVNGIPDFYLHSTTPRELDGQMKGEEEVGKKYGELYKLVRDKLIDSQIRKLYYYLWNREMTNTRVKVDKWKKGKK